MPSNGLLTFAIGETLAGSIPAEGRVRKWNGWHAIPGSMRLAFQPTAVKFDDTIYVFAVDYDDTGLYYQKAYRNGTFSGTWTKVANAPKTDAPIGVTATTEGIRVYVKDLWNNRVYENVLFISGADESWRGWGGPIGSYEVVWGSRRAAGTACTSPRSRARRRPARSPA